MRYKTRVLNKIRACFRSNFLERILCRLAKGSRPDSFVGKLLPSNYLYKKRSWREVRRNGILYRLDISDLVDWHIYFGLKDDSHLTLFSLCKPEHHVIDVGANNGAVMLQLSNLCQQGMVYGFEPDLRNFQRLQENAGRNALTNYRGYNLGLGEAEGHVTISTIDYNNMGMNRVDACAENGQRGFVTTIDHFASRESLLRLDLIKIDTEGYELKILRGATETLRRFRPVLFIELDDSNLRFQGDTAQELVSFLTDHFGYTIKEALSKRPVEKTSSFANCHYDIIAEIL